MKISQVYTVANTMSVTSKANPNFVVQVQPGEYKSFLKSLKVSFGMS